MGLIITNEARCRDCYRCLRSCPVKSIRITAGHESGALYARVIDDLCVHDARCVLACPQKAKKVVTHVEQVRAELKRGTPMIAGVAPSFVAGFPLDKPLQMPTLLRRLGFAQVEEISFGAQLVAAEHHRIGYAKPLISSACPVVVNLVERYYPELIDWLAPIVSPMIAHGRYWKKNCPQYKTVFIGPCAAKKAEAKVDELAGVIDYVLGFDELWDWIRDEQINLATLETANFDGPTPHLARLFPIEGGLYKSLGDAHGIDPEQNHLDESDFVSITGLQNCIDFLKYLTTSTAPKPKLMELLACRGGCIDGPLILGREDDLFMRRLKVANYQKEMAKAATSQPQHDDDLKDDTPGLDIPLDRHFVNRQINLPLPDEQAIKDILAKTGKYEPDDELNCGACGYDSCRDKAVAVYQGNAEVQMCIPYMRKRAESMSNLVLAAMPNAVIVVDRDLVIKEVNPSAVQMFNCFGQDLVGKPLQQFMNPNYFQQVLQTGQMVNVLNTHPQVNVVTREIIFPLEKESAVVGILVDITAEQKQQEQFELVKGQTIARAQEVITKQMKVAQEIAGLLGETTAETKVLLSKLIKLMQQDSL